MEYVYPMPKNIKVTYGIMVYLSNMYKKYSCLQDETIIYNFTYTKHMDQEMLAILQILFTKLRSKKNQIYFIGLSKEQKKMLIEFGLIDGTKVGDNSEKYISLNTFNADNEDKFRDYLNNELNSIESQEVSRFIITHIMEIFLNIRPHARNKTYKNKFGNKEVFSSCCFKKENSLLSISICNNGRTFCENITKKAKIECKKEWQYVKWALEKCNSTTNNRPGGAGLAMLKEFITNNRGQLTICSGKAYYSIQFDKEGNKFVETEELQTLMPGTIVIVKIATNVIKEVFVDKQQEFSIRDLI